MTSKKFVVLLALTCFVIIVWIIADIIHSKSNVPLDPNLEQALEPLTPTFDQNTLEKIKNIKSNFNAPTPSSSSSAPQQTIQKPGGV